MKQDKILYFGNNNKFSENEFFDGFAFSNFDYINGNDAFLHYTTINKFEKYADGNYVWIKKVFENDLYCKFILSRDYHGYYPIFYYKNGDEYRISNSMLYLAQTLTAEGKSLIPDYAQVQAWNSNLAFTQQATTFRTFVQSINILPTNKNIEITINKKNKSSTIQIVSRDIPIQTGTYQELLEKCLCIWRGRINTLINSNIAIRAELTGGLDSRTIFSFFCQDNLIDRGLKKKKLTIFSEPSSEEDFNIASQLIQIQNAKLNTSLEYEGQNSKLSALEMANLWKYFNIGRYAPIVFSPEYPLPNRINFGGEGGEENRFFYGSLSNPPIHNFDDYLTKFKSQFSKVEYFENWVQEVKNSISQIREDADSNLEDSILHYREFRSKNHTNKCPRNHNRIAILGSKYFKGFLHKASKEEVDLTMPFYDVMYANESRLLYLPFDEAHKNLNLRKIQLLKTAFSKFQGSGDAFMSTGDTFSEYLRTVDMSVFNVQKNQSKNPLSILLDDAQFIYEKNKNLIEDLCGNSFSKNLNSQFQSLIDVKNYNIHGRGYFLHNIFASTLFQPVANKKDSSRAVEFVDDAPKSITYFKR